MKPVRRDADRFGSDAKAHRATRRTCTSHGTNRTARRRTSEWGFRAFPHSDSGRAAGQSERAWRPSGYAARKGTVSDWRGWRGAPRRPPGGDRNVKGEGERETESEGESEAREG